VQGQPAGVAAHHLDHHHAVVAHGRGVDLVKALTRGVHRGLEAEGAFAAFQVVVDGLGTPMQLMPCLTRLAAPVMVPSPPMHTTASISLARRWSYTRSVTSAHSVFPLRSMAKYCGLAWLLVPRMVPPWVRMLETSFSSASACGSG